MARKGQSRLHIYMPEWLHIEMMAQVDKRNITITKFVCRALIEAIKKEKKYESQEL